MRGCGGTADASALGADAARHAGSSPVTRTKQTRSALPGFPAGRFFDAIFQFDYLLTDLVFESGNRRN